MKKLQLVKFFAFFALIFISKFAEAQCTTSGSNAEITGPVVCTSCDNTIASGTTASVTINTDGATWCVPSGQTSTITTLNWTKGILRVCGNLTITTLSVGFPSGAERARIILESTGTLTITNSFTLQALTGISNRSIMTFNGGGNYEQ